MLALGSYRETDHVFIGRKRDVFQWPGSRNLQDGCCSKQIEELIYYGQSIASSVLVSSSFGLASYTVVD